MSNDIILLIPSLLVIFILFYFTQFLSGKRQFYGVSLNSDYFDKKEFKLLDKQFKVLITIGFIIFLILLLVLIYVFKAYNLASLVPMSLYLIWLFVVYILIHNKVKILKSKLSLSLSDLNIGKTNVILDTKFISEKNKIIKIFSILFIIPFILLVFIGIYTLSQYSIIPSNIPVHWGSNGLADRFVEKSLFTILFIVFMMISFGFIIYISSIGSLKSRIKLSVDNINKSKKSHISYIYKFGSGFLILSTTCQLMFINILISTIKGGDINTIITTIYTTIIILDTIYLTYIFYKSPNKSKEANYSIDDEDSLWILGFLYNNPNDPSLFIQKRFGIGWTINIGTTKGKLFLSVPIILSILALIFI
ncbi:MAG: DUF5808 domain-containing protein [Romboutsia sp.]